MPCGPLFKVDATSINSYEYAVYWDGRKSSSHRRGASGMSMCQCLGEQPENELSISLIIFQVIVTRKAAREVRADLTPDGQTTVATST